MKISVGDELKSKTKTKISIYIYIYLALRIKNICETFDFGSIEHYLKEIIIYINYQCINNLNYLLIFIQFLLFYC